MTKLEKIKAQNNVLNEKIEINFSPVKEVIVDYKLTVELIEQFNEDNKKIMSEILKKVTEELKNVKGVKVNSANFNNVLQIALEKFGEDYLENISNEMKLERSEALVFSFEEAPNKQELIDYFNSLNEDKKIVEMFYRNFMFSCYDEFSEKINKFNDPEKINAGK